MPNVLVASSDITTRLAEAQRLADEVATLEEQVKDRKALLRQIEENELTELVTPEMMDDETVVQVAENVFVRFERKMYCGIDAADRDAAHLWLEENGHGQMLKRNVTLSLGKDSRDAVARVQRFVNQLLPHFEVQVIVPARGDNRLKDFLEYVCAEAGIDKPSVELGTELPGATLAAWVRKRLRAGASLPDFFNVYAPVKATRVPAPDTWSDADGKWWHRAETSPVGPFEDEATAHEAFAETQQHVLSVADAKPATQTL